MINLKIGENIFNVLSIGQAVQNPLTGGRKSLEVVLKTTLDFNSIHQVFSTESNIQNLVFENYSGEDTTSLIGQTLFSGYTELGESISMKKEGEEFIYTLLLYKSNDALQTQLDEANAKIVSIANELENAQNAINALMLS